MQGDFTRSTFKADKHYSSVRMQQGRVQLDADWNEQLDIGEHLDRTTNRDVIGVNGAPKTGGGFEIGVSGDHKTYTVTAGRIYADGILVESDAPQTVPVPPILADRTDLVYLDVWERHITAVEDPAIREIALGGPDTCTRTEVVAQVKVTQDSAPPAPGGGRLTVELEAVPPATSPCQPTPAGGYRGLENHLYRVEIHTGGALGTATFKWSRDNGSLVAAVEKFVSANQIQVTNLGRDQVMSFKKDDWAEVIDDASELSLKAGTLAQITDLNATTRILTLSKSVSGFDLNGHPKIRRWDQASDAIPTAAGPIALEDGIEVRFSGEDFRPGDYWSFAARSTDATLETFTDAPPQGILHHYCALATVVWSSTGPKLTDLRPEFPPLTDLTAEDVTYDNKICGFPGAKTVQDALDRLCRSRRPALPQQAPARLGHRLRAARGLRAGPREGDPAYRLCDRLRRQRHRAQEA